MLFSVVKKLSSHIGLIWSVTETVTNQLISDAYYTLKSMIGRLYTASSSKGTQGFLPVSSSKVMFLMHWVDSLKALITGLTKDCY